MFNPNALKLLDLQQLSAMAEQIMLREEVDFDELDQIAEEMKSRVAKFNRMVKNVHYGLSKPQDLKTVPGIGQTSKRKQ